MKGDRLQALGVIPARANSSRFPLKVIAPILGKPLVQYVWEAATRARRLSRVVIATDDIQVARIAEGFGAKVALTPSHLTSGTDRVALIAQDDPAAIVVNLQGDEPLLGPEAIDRLVQTLVDFPQAGMATLAVRSSAELSNPNVVKVVLSDQGEALYFSRQPLASFPDGAFFKHIGVYAYRRDVLQAFCRWKPAPLELTEKLEQLRALANGVRIQVAVVEEDTIAVDVPEDVRRVESVLNDRKRAVEKGSAN